MFGYVRYDIPNLYIKDFMLYKAMYCGLCKGIGASCGQMAREIGRASCRERVFITV